MNEPNARAVSENPFCTRRVRPGAIPFLFPPDQTAEALIERLDETASECETSVVLALAPRSVRPAPSAGPGDPSQATAFKGERLIAAWVDAMATALAAKWPTLGE